MHIIPLNIIEPQTVYTGSTVWCVLLSNVPKGDFVSWIRHCIDASSHINGHDLKRKHHFIVVCLEACLLVFCKKKRKKKIQQISCRFVAAVSASTPKWSIRLLSNRSSRKVMLTFKAPARAWHDLSGSSMVALEILSIYYSLYSLIFTIILYNILYIYTI